MATARRHGLATAAAVVVLAVAVSSSPATAGAVGSPGTVVLPSVGVIDTHVHLTNTSVLSYTWCTTPGQGMPLCQHNLGTWTVDDLVQQSAGAALQPNKFVFCEVAAEPRDWAKEPRYIQSLADAQPPGAGVPKIGGILAHVSLQAADVAATLDELLRDVPLLRGVRQADMNNDLLNASFVNGVREMGKRNLVLDVGATGVWASLHKLISLVPETTFMLEHMGEPKIHGGTQQDWDDWANNMTAIAALPNAHIMISGGPQQADGGVFGNWTVAQVAPYVKHLWRVFGFERSTFAGNWFFLNLGGTYVQWAEAVATYLSDVQATAEQRQAFYAGTATKVYRL